MSPLSKQEVFTKAFIGIRDQDFRRSMRPDVSLCAYRGRDDRRCAIGHLIPDDLYHRQMDAQGLDVSGVTRCFPHILKLFQDVPLSFLADLQHLHDVCDEPDEMERRLRRFAEIHQLEIPT